MMMPGPYLLVTGRRIPAYRFFALLGLALGIGTATGIARSIGVALTAVAAVIGVGLAGAVALVALRVACGRGDLVWSEHEGVVLATTVAVGSIVGDPRPLLDAIAPGLVIILACGRVGCLLAGCCHGRPARAGARLAVRYSRAHAMAGFSSELVGVPLVPVQIGESGWCAVVAVGGTALALAHAPAGATLVAVFGARAAGRIAAERLRGDDGRLAPGPGTVPQYWALGVVGLLLVATAGGSLPVGAWTAAPAAAMLLFVASTLTRTRGLGTVGSPSQLCPGGSVALRLRRRDEPGPGGLGRGSLPRNRTAGRR
jgi:hypothetical protein